jgi:hypothetical protein
MDQFYQALLHNPFLLYINSSPVLSDLVEMTHFIGFMLLVGSIAIVDLRILGLAGRHRTAAALAQDLYPWAWIGFFLALISGFVMFAGDAPDFGHSWVFQVKVVWIILALIVGMAVQRKVSSWEQPDSQSLPAGAKFVALISLILWIGAILVSVEVPAISGVS